MTKTGEGKLLLGQVREISKDLLERLKEIDDKLAKLQDLVDNREEIDREWIIEELNDIRDKIGLMEKEDTQELEEEEILENMMTKLNSLIEMTFG